MAFRYRHPPLCRLWRPHPPTPSCTHPVVRRHLRTSSVLRDRSFTNILADENTPALQVSSVSEAGVLLADGLLVPGGCILLDGKVFLWDVPMNACQPEHFEIFEMVVPRPEVLLLGTGKRTSQVPLATRRYLNSLGLLCEVTATRNACATFNLLAEEGRRVAAALLPLTPHQWNKTTLGANPSGDRA